MAPPSAAQREISPESGRAKRHVLLVASAFPPSAGPGARRALRFARGLAAHGMRVSVLTLEDRFHYLGIDPLSRSDAEGSFEVLRTGTWDPIARMKARRGLSHHGVVHPGGATTPSGDRPIAPLPVRMASEVLRSVLLPDTEVAWVPPASRRALAVHARDPIDVVIATLPPRSALVGAAYIAGRTGARLVVDYRDPWAADRAHSPPRPRWLQAIDARIERRCLRRAALALFTSPSALAFYRREFPWLPRLEVLYNGIDSWTPRADGSPPPPLTWTYAGELYDGRNLTVVVRAMAALRERVDARLVVVGSEPTAERALGRELGVEDRIEYVGRLPFRSTLERLRRSHRLVAMIPAAHSLSIPAKVFDYLGTRRPLLLLCDPDHAAAAVLAGIPQHRVLHPDDVAGVEVLLSEDAASLCGGGMPDVDAEALERFDAGAQMRQLAGWIREL